MDPMSYMLSGVFLTLAAQNLMVVEPLKYKVKHTKKEKKLINSCLIKCGIYMALMIFLTCAGHTGILK